MLNRMLIATGALMVATSPAVAASLVSPDLGSTATFAPTPGTLIDFDSALPAGFTVTGGNYRTGSDGVSSQIGFSDGSTYFSAIGNAPNSNLGPATIQQTNGTGYASVSLFIGSIDDFNTIVLLDTAGNPIQSFTGAQIGPPANGDLTAPETNRRVTFFKSDNDPLIGGIRLSSTFNSLEVDNVVFAVPEPATWMMMIAGFGLVGGAARSLRRQGTLARA